MLPDSGPAGSQFVSIFTGSAWLLLHLAPPFSAHAPSDSKQLLINLLSNSLPHPFSFFKGPLPDGQTPCVVWGAQHKPFPTLSLTKLFRSPAPDVMLHSPNPKPASQPHLFVRQSHLLWEVRSYELIAHATETGNDLREPLAGDPLLPAAPRITCCLLSVFTKTPLHLAYPPGCPVVLRQRTNRISRRTPTR